ncbi:hypothetical protein [Desertimonas flava]|uniref:hypothetical protein n=1 Tax=Desertimonas flava TaxID=2064846 RepID=UPI0013C50425|nr:hypothetical protein [Desertimonas flava]
MSREWNWHRLEVGETNVPFNGCVAAHRRDARGMACEAIADARRRPKRELDLGWTLGYLLAELDLKPAGPQREGLVGPV